MTESVHSDDSEQGVAGRARQLLQDTFSPSILVRLQYAMYLFVGLALCLILKGAGGKALSDATILQRGCDVLMQIEQHEGTSTSTTTATALNVACVENTLAYRVSFSLAVFFLIHALSVSDLTCCIPARARAQMQERFFTVKSVLLLLCLIFVFTCVPNSFFAGYAWLCMGVSGLFLVIQIILLVDFSYQWNEEWGERASQGVVKWQWYLVIVAFGCYAVGIGATIYSYVMFVPHGDCNLNAFAITEVVIAAVVFTMVSVWVPHGSILPSGIVFAYCAVQELVALRATDDMYCNPTFAASAGGGSSTKSLLLTSCFSGLMLAYAVVSSGGSRTSLSLDESSAQEDPDRDGHLAGYFFFHLIMTAGSMYLAMLVTDWTVSGNGQSNVTKGLTAAFWVKHASLWLTQLVYVWSLLAPYYCCQDRDFGFATDDW